MIRFVLIPLALAAATAQTPTLSATQPARSRQPVEQTPAEPRELVIYDVQDIVGMYSTPDEGPAQAATRKRESMQRLIELLEAFAPLSGAESIVEMPGGASTSLGVHAEAATHRWVADWLEQQRFLQLIEIDARFLEAERSTLLELGIDPSKSIIVEKEALDRLFVTSSGKALDLVTAPRLLTRSASRAQVKSVERVAYIKAWKLETVEPGGVEIADPIIDTIDEGIELDVLATLLPDGNIGLLLSASRTSIQRPISTQRVTLREGLDTQVEIAVPVVDRRAVETRMVLSDGATAILCSFGHEQAFAVLVTVRIVPPRFEGPGDKAR